MLERLFLRRQRMLRLLARGNSKTAVIKAVSKEFGCSESVVAKDYQRMRTWLHTIKEDEQLCGILRERLDLLSREALDLMLDWENGKDLTVAEKFVKIGALNSALKITVEQIKLAQELGLIEHKPIEINQNLSMTTPFEADPVLRQALLKSIAEQKVEKEVQDKQREKERREGNGDSAESTDEAGS